TTAATQEATQEVSTPTPAVNVRAHLAALGDIVDEVQGARGANTLLNQYWSDVRASGTRAGCTQAAPTIPADYVLPEADGQAVPNLKLAVDLINGGLRFLRQGWTQYTNACNANNLPAALEGGSQTAQNASSAFENAQTLLNAVRNSAG